MSQSFEHRSAWEAGWQRAEKIAEKTLSGIVLPGTDRKYPNARFRAFQTSVKLWERLCSRELRSEDDVRHAANRIGLILERDHQQMIAQGDFPIKFNQFQKIGKGTSIYTELEWMADVYDFSIGDAGRHQDTLMDFDLGGWKPWEIMYVTGLRAIDDAARAIAADEIELGMTLVYDALNEMYMCDIFANGNERNKEYSTRTDRIYGRKPRDVEVAEMVNEKLAQAVKEAIKEDRIQLATAAAIKRNERNTNMRKFVLERWNKEKASYKENKSDFARHYSRLLLQKHAFKVAESTIATRWLLGI